jgi:cysteinyl-tRNA synthetase
VLHLNDARGKMSKSKGDFLTVSLLEEKGYDPLAYRLFCLQSHYRKPLIFSFENLDNAAGAYTKLINRIAAIPVEGEVDMEVFEAQKKAFIEAVGNDLNTSLGLTAVYDVLKLKTNGNTKRAIIDDFDKVLSLNLLAAAEKAQKAKAAAEEPKQADHGLSDEEVAEIESLIAQRTEARKAKNWAEADRIRDALTAKGVVVKDTKDGIQWTVNK